VVGAGLSGVGSMGGGMGAGLSGVRGVFFGEAEAVHVVENGRTVVVFRTVAHATAQFRSFFLASQDGDGVLAAQRALFAGEHGATELVVVVQRR